MNSAALNGDHDDRKRADGPGATSDGSTDTAPTPGHQHATYQLFLLLAFTEILLGFVWFKGSVPAPALIFGHCLIVALMGLLWRGAKTRDLQLVPIGFTGVLFTGPLGAAGILLLALVLKLKKPERELLDNWYERLTQSTRHDKENQLYRSIKSGRAPKSGSTARIEKNPSTISSFYSIVEQGDLTQKQSLLGIIALKYHPDFFPLLKTALRDAEPTVRVQAAAVYAKLQMQYKARLATACTLQANDHKLRRKRKKELRNCIKSGFLDKAGLARAHLAIKTQEAYYVISPVA